MSLPKFNEDVQIISKLDDEPNDVGGLSAAELKARFDLASVLIKSFLNETLLPYLEAVTGAGSIGITDIPGLNDAATVQAALVELKTQLNNATAGSIPDRSLSGSKLEAGAVGTNELANGSISGVKLAGGVITDDKIAPVKLSGAVIRDKSISNQHLNGKVIKAENVVDNTLTGNQLADLTIPAGKIANLAVQTAKIANNAVTGDKIAPRAVTRENVADDALYSPVLRPVTTSYAIPASDFGKTYVDPYTYRNNDISLTMSKALMDAAPVGAEIAFARIYNQKSVKLTVTGVRIINADSGQIGGASATVTLSLPERGSMFALKKTESDATYGSMWILTGDVEVEA